MSAVSEVATQPGELPRSMLAWVLRPEREGDLEGYEIEEVEVPEPGPFEVVVRVMAAGVNFNSVWVALGQPVSVFSEGDHPEHGHHIGGSDGSGVVWRVGAGVTRWKPGDEVVLHATQASYEDPEVHGLDPLAAPSHLVWGYQTTWGSFAQFCKVQAQQLLPKPPALSWADSCSYGGTYFTAYRMLIDQCRLRAGQNVLVWGAAGGLGVFALQLCRIAGANSVGVVSSAEKAELAKRLGALECIDRREYAGMRRLGGEGPEQERRRAGVMRDFAKRVRELLGDSPDVVFEHVGKEVFPTSVFTVKPFGKVVICGATTGYEVDFDVRYLWMRQKQVLGSHIFNAYEAWRANELVHQGRIRPVVWGALPFDRLHDANRLVYENRSLGKVAILVGARDEEEGQTVPGPGAIRVGPGV